MQGNYRYEQARAGISCCGYLSILISLTLLSTALLSLAILDRESLLTAFSNNNSKSVGREKLGERLYRSEFESFRMRHRKNYLTAEEKEKRYEVFREHMEYINKQNRDSSSSFTLGMNPTGDWTDEEFKKYRGCSGSKPTPRARARGRGRAGTRAEAEEQRDMKQSTNSQHLHSEISIDWRPYLPPIKDQCMCGSCWTFSGVASLEAFYSIHNNQSIITLSEQLMVDCVSDPLYPRNHGCNGGWFEDVFAFAAKYGVTTEALYPYLAIDSVCRKDEVSLFKFSTGFEHVPSGDQDAMLARLKVQPMSIDISAGDWMFRFYKKGIIEYGCGHELGHCVNVVGAGEEEGVKYWLIRNSWGRNWGEEGGYLKVLREPGTGHPGVCGIAINPAYPTGN